MSNPFDLEEPEKLAVFVQEFVRHEGQEDCAVIAVIRSQLRDPRYSPSLMAERILSKPEIQAAIKAARSFYKPPQSKDISPQTISDDMEVIYSQCLDDRQYQAAISAKKMQAEIHGFMKQDININVKHSIESLSDAELERIARRGVIEGEFTEVKKGLPALHVEES